MATLNLEFTEWVPRTEYSATMHYPLMQAVTGIDTTVEANRPRAAREFVKAWDFAFWWSTSLLYDITVQTDMGHAVYAAGGTDFRDTIHCPFKTVEEVLDFDPAATFPSRELSDIARRYDEDYDRQQAEFPDCLVTIGVYDTMFSGLISIFGWEMLLLSGGSDPRRFGRVMESYHRWIKPYFEAAAESKAPAFMCHDDIAWTSGAVFHPDWYRRYVFPKYKELWRPLREAGKKVLFTSDGNYTAFFDDIVACGAHCLVMEPSCDMAGFAAKYGRTHGFVGNADTRILLTGTREGIRNEVQRCMDIGKPCPGFILAVGNHIPPNTPVENALYYNEVYLELRRR
jgi:hypothetical protein